jgi:ribonuclease HI
VVTWCSAAAAAASCSRLEKGLRLITNTEKSTKIDKVVIYADGASRGNPGEAAIGAIIRNEQGRLIATISQRIGTTTNNQAEYRAVIAAMEKAIRLGARHVELNSDSELVVKQLSGRYRVKKAALKPLYRRVKQLESNFESLTITRIPRQQNTEADRLANQALSPQLT